jgi:hypothetical protein
MISVIQLDSGPMAFVSDLVPGSAWVHLPVYMGYDRFPEQKYDEKVKLFEQILEKKGSLFFTHDPVVNHGKLTRDSQGRYGVI